MAVSTTFRIVPLSEVDEVLEASWKRLADRALEPNAFQDPRFLLPSATREDAKTLRLAVVENGPELLAVLAFSVEPVRASGPFHAVSTRGPFMEQVGDLRHPLLAPEDPERTWELLLRGLRRSGLPGLLQLENFPGDGLLGSSLSAVADRLRIPIIERERDERAFASAVPSEGAPDDVPQFALAHSSAKTRKKRALVVRQLEDALGSKLRVVDRGADPKGIERFLDLEASGWKGDPSRGGHALRTTQQDAWFADVATAFRDDGKLAVFTLESAKGDLFISVSFASGGGIFACLDARDEDYSDYGPGTLGRIAEWQHFVTSPGVDFFDPNLSSFYAESTRLYPERRPHVTLLLAHGGIVPRTLLRAAPLVSRLRAVARTRVGRLAR